MKSCSYTQYGCVDEDLKDCDEQVDRPPLCVVDGPCHAGPTGCLEDKTGKDDGLSPGTYVGHCPKPKSPEAKCDECLAGCSERHPRTEPAFQQCLNRLCRMACHGGLLHKAQYNDAKQFCTKEGHELGDVKFQICVKKALDGTVPEPRRCGLQFQDTELYCTGLGYERGKFEFQGCIKASFDGICSEEYRCSPQFRDARKYCIRQTKVIGGSDFQKCISDQLVDVCPKDVGCKKRHTDAREFCKKEGNGHTFGSPEWQGCVARMLNPSCPKDFNCEQRKRDTVSYCTHKKGLKDGTSEYAACMKEALGEICPGLSGVMLDSSEQQFLEL